MTGCLYRRLADAGAIVPPARSLQAIRQNVKEAIMVQPPLVFSSDGALDQVSSVALLAAEEKGGETTITDAHSVPFSHHLLLRRASTPPPTGAPAPSS